MPRPKLLKEPKFTSFYLSVEIYEKLREVARAQGKSVSQLLREIVELYLHERGREA
ncbi:MAG: ribbon-helix-helix domain-containing protein [Thermosphaera sp.]|nr:ribbon-helix-helix domain-containing protein [Thermosphaera sp.]